MLRSIHITDTGPSPRLNLDLGERLNVLTGDNGLGKSFLLDVAWWALTGTWVGRPASPRSTGGHPTIEWVIEGKGGQPTTKHVRFIRANQRWERPRGKPSMPGLVVYARVDGSFSVWDPARNYWKQFQARGIDDPDRPDAYHFSKEAVWTGLAMGERSVCNGLLRDWIRWQRAPDQGEHAPFQLLRKALIALSPPREPIRPGDKPVRLSVGDSLDYPTLVGHDGEPLPVVHSSAAVQRILALTYLLVWAWSEHLEASTLLAQPPTPRMVFLMDEVETHLHPKWQRRLLPALLGVVENLGATISVQSIVTTHAPLVLASVETYFNPERDRFFRLDIRDKQVALNESPWMKYGDAVGWLTSDIFDLEEARSIEAERAIRAAYAFMRGAAAELPAELATRDAIHNELTRTLPSDDPFWPQWIAPPRRGTP